MDHCVRRKGPARLFCVLTRECAKRSNFPSNLRQLHRQATPRDARQEKPRGIHGVLSVGQPAHPNTAPPLLCHPLRRSGGSVCRGHGRVTPCRIRQGQDVKTLTDTGAAQHDRGPRGAGCLRRRHLPGGQRDAKCSAALQGDWGQVNPSWPAAILLPRGGGAPGALYQAPGGRGVRPDTCWLPALGRPVRGGCILAVLLVVSVVCV